LLLLHLLRQLGWAILLLLLLLLLLVVVALVLLPGMVAGVVVMMAVVLMVERYGVRDWPLALLSMLPLLLPLLLVCQLLRCVTTVGNMLHPVWRKP
jgi:hypothetical protein